MRRASSRLRLSYLRSRRRRTTTYYHNDLLGSPVAATDASGHVIWRESYRPYGERLTNDPASTANDVWYTSRRQDADTGLVYMGARYYDPVAGRFVSKDPVGFDEGNVQSFNRYAYANDNPYRYVDPDGREPGDLYQRGYALPIPNFSAEPGLAHSIPEVGVFALLVPGPGAAIAGMILRGAADEAPVPQEVATEIQLSRSQHGEAADHAADAHAAGQPDVLTIDRSGASGRRQEAIGDLEKVPGKHLDEYPPAMFQEGGSGASVRAISPRDNMSAGACIGNACRGLPDGARVRIRVGE